MCGRYTLSTDGATLAHVYGVTELQGWEPRYNIAPTQFVPALIDRDGERHFELFHWGLVPSWAKERKIGARMINARAETIAEKPSFRAAFKYRRCAILADGYYEWVKRSDGKQTYYMRPTNGETFTFAGLWEKWLSADGSELLSCSIVTCAANDDLAHLHHRMPVVLAPSAMDSWLAASTTTSDAATLLRPAPPGSFNPIAVSAYVNSASREGPDCVAPVSA